MFFASPVGKLKDWRYVDVEEMVALFLHILAHYVKNGVIKFQFLRFGSRIC